MKKVATYLALATLLLTGIPMAIAQKRFDVKPFGLMNSQTKTLLYLGQSREEAIQALGKPTKMDKLFSEIDMKKVDVWYYNANKLYFLNDALVTFELHDNTLVFGRSYEEAFGVGAQLTGEGPAPNARSANDGGNYQVNKMSLADLKVDNKPGKSANVRYNRMASNHTKFGDMKMGSYFEMLFDSNDKVVFVGLHN